MTNAIVNCDGFLFERVFELTKLLKKYGIGEWATPKSPTIFKPTHRG
jgi:hypothetical protein